MSKKEKTGQGKYHNWFSVKTIKEYWKTRWMLLAIPLLAVLFTEYLLRLSFLDMVLFSIQNPFDFILNFLLAASVYFVSLGIFSNKYAGTGSVFLLSGVLGFAGRIKFMYRQTGPMLADVGVLGEAGAMWRLLTTEMIVKSLLATVLFGVFLYGITYNAKWNKISLQERMAGIVLFLFVWACAYYWMPVQLYQTQNGITEKQSAQRIGSYVYFAATLNNTSVLPMNKEGDSIHNTPILPTGDSTSGEILVPKGALESWFTNIQQNTESEHTPDIIVIQSESFYDPTQTIENELFSRDPLPYFHRLQKESNAFTAITPAFGGDTVNAEFEVLTGLPTAVFPTGVNMFTDIVQKPLMGLGWILHSQGYETSAIHPFNTEYYRRDAVYQMVGFDKFAGLESLEKNDSEFHANAFTERDIYANDIELTNQIIKQLELKKQGNTFVFAISMQNHMPYANQYPGYEIEYKGEGNPRAVQEFSNFLSGLRKTDQSLQNLIEYLRTREKETIVLFYGDHQPALELNRVVSNSGNAEKNQQRHQVPALIWSNKSTLSTEQQQVDMTSVSEMLLSAGGLEIPPHYQMLRNLREQGLSAFTDYYAIVNDEIFYRDSPQYQKIYTEFESMKQSVWDFEPKR